MHTESERQIFKFFDGKTERFADPLRVHRRLVHALAGKLSETVTDSEADDIGVQAPAQEKLYAAVRHAFEMPAFNTADGTGATDKHADDALTAFLEWLDRGKQNAGNSLT